MIKMVETETKNIYRFPMLFASTGEPGESRIRHASHLRFRTKVMQKKGSKRTKHTSTFFKVL